MSVGQAGTPTDTPVATSAMALAEDGDSRSGTLVTKPSGGYLGDMVSRRTLNRDNFPRTGKGLASEISRTDSRRQQPRPLMWGCFGGISKIHIQIFPLKSY